MGPGVRVQPDQRADSFVERPHYNRGVFTHCSRPSCSNELPKPYSKSRWCLECLRESQAVRRRADPEKFRQRDRVYRATKTPEQRQRDVELRTAARYGITHELYRELIDEAMANGCAICGTMELHWSAAKKLPPIDHDHATGRVRGVLCHQCNVGVGSFKDDVRLLEAAISYLNRHHS